MKRNLIAGLPYVSRRRVRPLPRRWINGWLNQPLF